MKLFGTLCLMGVLTFSANAGTIFDTLTGATVTGQDAVVAPPGLDVNGNSNNGPLYDQFSSDANITGSTLTSLELSLIAGDPTDGGSVTVGLYSDSAGSPGALLATLGTVLDSSLTTCTSGAGLCTDVTPPPVQDLSGLSAALGTSTEYWLGLSTTDGSSALWDYEGFGAATTQTGTTGQFYNSAEGTFPDVDGPYLAQINASDNPVIISGTPEPATFVLLGSSVLALGLFKRKRSNQ